MRSELVFLILLVFLAPAARAAQLFEYSRPIRSLGMGGVLLPYVDENTAVAWNPARLSTVDELSWQIFDVGLGANGKEVYDLYKAMQDSGCSGSSCYGSFYGTPVWVGFQASTTIVAPRIGVSAYSYTGYLEGTLHNPAFPSFNVTYLNDSGFAAAYGFPLKDGFHGGVALKRITRVGGTQDISLSTITSGGKNFLEQFDQRGTAYGIDLGFQTETGGPINSILGISWKDVGSTAFVRDGQYTQPDRIHDNLSIGIGNEIDLPGLDMRLGVEINHLTEPDIQFGKKLHAGAELGLPFIDVRAGLNQGYPTLGVTLDFLIFRLDAASYTEEVGVYPGQSPSARYKIGLSLDIAVAADFSFTTKDGKRRKLKQRR